MFIVGIPHNVQSARSAQRPLNEIYSTTTRVVATLAADPQTRRAAAGLHPEQTVARQMTVGWLVDAVDQHRVPQRKRLTLSDLASNRFRLSFYQRDASGPRTRCSTLVRPTVFRLRKGDVLGVSTGTLLLTPATPVFLNPGLVFDPPDGESVEVLRDAGPVRLGPYLDEPPPRVLPRLNRCRGCLPCSLRE